MAIEVTLTRDPTDPNPPDYTLVDSVRLDVRGKGMERSWTPELSGATTESVKATYVFADDGSDVPTPIRLLVMPWINLIGIGERRCEAFYLTARFDI